jgi:hypothetical protein
LRVKLAGPVSRAPFWEAAGLRANFSLD